MLKKLNFGNKSSNKEEPKQDSQPQDNSTPQNNPTSSVSTSDLPKLTNKKAGQKMTALLLDQIKKLIEINNQNESKINELNKTISSLKSELEDAKKSVGKYDDRIQKMEQSMDKILGLYELVSNQYNPFVNNQQSDNQPQQSQIIKDIYLGDDNSQAADESNTTNQTTSDQKSPSIMNKEGTDDEHPIIQKKKAKLPSQTLANYILYQFQKGKSLDHIRQPLLQVGWAEDTIENTIRLLELKQD